MATTRSPHELLGVPVDADVDEIERAYKRQLAALHPDGAPDPAERARRDQLCRELGEAYHLLTDPASRAAYDDGQAGETAEAPADDHDPFAEGWRRQPPGAHGYGPGYATPPPQPPPPQPPAPRAVSLWAAATLGTAVATVQIVVRASGVYAAWHPQPDDGWLVTALHSFLVATMETARFPPIIVFVLLAGAAIGAAVFGRRSHTNTREKTLWTAAGATAALLLTEFVLWMLAALFASLLLVVVILVGGLLLLLGMLLGRD